MSVYTNGDVCISILHEPGEDVFNPQVLGFSPGNNGCFSVFKTDGMCSDVLICFMLRDIARQETAAMRWNPIHTVETIVIRSCPSLSHPSLL